MLKTYLRAAALALLASLPAAAADNIFVKLDGAVPAILSNGAGFTTEKGDCYPFVAYDQAQTLMELKFGDFTFWIRKSDGEIVPPGATADAAAKYRADEAKFRAAAMEPGMRPGQPPGEDTAGAVERLLEEPLRAAIREEVRTAASGKEGDREVDAFPVDATDAAWQNTGVRVRIGQHVTIQAAEGELWDLGQGKTNANGYNFVPGNAGTAVFHPGIVNEDWHWGALICAVGDGEGEIADARHQLEAGLKHEFTARNAGYVYLICNDNPQLPNGGNGYDDNSGIIHVKVTVNDAPGQPGAVPGEAPMPAGSLILDGPAATGSAAAVPPDFAAPGADTPAEMARRLLNPLRTLIQQTLRTSLAGKHGGHDAKAFPVDAARPSWQNSGVLVKPGQHVMVEAAPGDTWDDGWGPVDAKGYGAPRDLGAGTPVFHTGRPNDDWHWGSLICAVGKSRGALDDPDHEVEVGLQRGFTVDDGGYVYFMTNDNRQLPDGRNGFFDNLGIIHVQVTVTDPPKQPDVKLDTAPPAAKPSLQAGKALAAPAEQPVRD